MTKKIILTGIALLLILSSCIDRNEEFSIEEIEGLKKINAKDFKKRDSLNLKTHQDEYPKKDTLNKEQALQTVDPKDVVVPPH